MNDDSSNGRPWRILRPLVILGAVAALTRGFMVLKDRIGKGVKINATAKASFAMDTPGKRKVKRTATASVGRKRPRKGRRAK